MRTTSSFRALLALPFLALTLLLASCGSGDKGKTGSTPSMLSGTDHKEWKTSREETATGDKVKQTSADKDERLTFYANGQFNMAATAATANGTWVYDDASRNLALTFADASAKSENFKVLTLTEKQVELQAADGTKMTLKEE